MNNSRYGLTGAITTFLNLPALIKIRKLQPLPIPDAGKIADSLTAAIAHRLSSAEEAQVAAIEAIRRELRNDRQEISFVDYGAGEAGSERMPQQMAAGIALSRTVADISRSAKKYFWTVFFLKLIREFQPKICIELGANLGISAAYQAAALQLNGAGRLITIEGAEALAARAEQNLSRLGLNNVLVVRGKFADVLPDILKQNNPVNYAFVDGHHAEKPTLAYFRQLLPYMATGSLMIFDDISWSAGMRRAWDKIRGNEKVRLALELNSVGLCLVNDERLPKHYVKIPIVVN